MTDTLMTCIIDQFAICIIRSIDQVHTDSQRWRNERHPLTAKGGFRFVTMSVPRKVALRSHG